MKPFGFRVLKHLKVFDLPVIGCLIVTLGVGQKFQTIHETEDRGCQPTGHHQPTKALDQGGPAMVATEFFNHFSGTCAMQR